MYLNIIHLLNYISVYTKLLRPYKLFTRLYLFRMSYRSFFDFKTFYYYFPPSLCFSIQHFYKRLMLSRFDFLMFTINYFFIDRLKLIDHDFKTNFNNSNIILGMRNMNYFRHSGIMFLDHLTKSYYSMHNTTIFRQKSLHALLHFMYDWFTIFAVKFKNIGFYTYEVDPLWLGDISVDDHWLWYEYWYDRNLLYSFQSIDTITWDIFSMSEHYHYIYNLYKVGSFNTFKIETYFDTAYILYYDLFLAYFHKVLKLRLNAYQLSILSYLNDLALKLYYSVKYFEKYYLCSFKLREKMIINKYNNLFIKVWLDYKKLYNYSAYYWNFIDAYSEGPVHSMTYWHYNYFQNNYMEDALLQMKYITKEPTFIKNMIIYRKIIAYRKFVIRETGRKYSASMAKRKIKLRVYRITTLIRKKKKWVLLFPSFHQQSKIIDFLKIKKGRKQQKLVSKVINKKARLILRAKYNGGKKVFRNNG